MIDPGKPADEERRLRALRALEILDTESEGRFDRITRLAQRIFGTDMVAVSLIDEDRQWLKSIQGPLEREGPRREAFCAHAILEPGSTLVVEDAASDERFAGNPTVTGDPGVRFYAGHPIAGPGGEAIGTLCVVDPAPRPASEFDAEALRDLALMVEREISTLSLAMGDALTGLSNRRGFELLGDRAVNLAGRLQLPVAAVYADIDEMKPINDELGHDAGDRAILACARLLEANLRESDVLARLGGDEFCALLFGAAAEGAESAVERLKDELAGWNEGSEEPFELAISFGVSRSRNDKRVSLSTLVAEADQRMLHGKRGRKIRP